MTDKSIKQQEIHKFSGDLPHEKLTDVVAVEEPLEIRIEYSPMGLSSQREQKGISITMRTPGNDFELAAGFLLTEGIISDAEQVRKIDFCGPASGEMQLRNTVKVELHPTVAVDLKRLERHFYTTSSCGVCGKTSLEALYVQGQKAIDSDQFMVQAESLYKLSGALRKQQAVFNQTGGIHASAAFDVDANIVQIREDVGRHNALDKLIGHQLLSMKSPPMSYGIMVSGRASFELLQKAMMARSPMLVAVGAPSSLAVELAESFKMTLVGFLGGDSFNIYTGAQRIV